VSSLQLNTEPINPTIPRHVAIIMDGNGRWANRRGHARFFGHVRGTERVREIVEEAIQLGVDALTLYAFSTENWKRPEDELSILWKLLLKHLKREREHMQKNNVRLRVMGEVDRLPAEVQRQVAVTMDMLSANTGLVVTFAVSYGSRREITASAKKIAQAVASGGLRVDEIDENAVAKYLWTADMQDLADVDLLIRTSGEMRISNFLLWQSAYAELEFVDECWPDFTRERFRDVIVKYGKRERRYGGIQK